MKKPLLFCTTIAALAAVTPAFAVTFDPITDADLLALRGAPGTAVLVTNAALDPVLDADLMALGGRPGSTPLAARTEFDPVLDADLLALRPRAASSQGVSAAACMMAGCTRTACGHR